MMNQAPSESIYGIMLAMAEVGLKIYIFATKDRTHSGVAVDEEKAKEIISPENLEKGVQENGKVYFEGEAADAVNKEILEKGLFTNKLYEKLVLENEHMYEEAAGDEYLPLSDYEIGGDGIEIGDRGFENGG